MAPRRRRRGRRNSRRAHTLGPGRFQRPAKRRMDSHDRPHASRLPSFSILSKAVGYPLRRQHKEMPSVPTRAPTKWMPAGLAHDDKCIAHHSPCPALCCHLSCPPLPPSPANLLSRLSLAGHHPRYPHRPHHPPRSPSAPSPPSPLLTLATPRLTFTTLLARRHHPHQVHRRAAARGEDAPAARARDGGDAPEATPPVSPAAHCLRGVPGRVRHRLRALGAQHAELPVALAVPAP